MNRDGEVVTTAAAGARPGFGVQVATGIVAAMAVVCVAVLALMAFRYAGWKRADSLNHPQLLQLRHEFSEHPDRDVLKGQIRAMDLAMRREYFDGQWRLRQGARLLLFSAVLMLVAMGYLTLMEDTIPDVEQLKGSESAWARGARRRWAIAVGGAVGLILVMLAGLVWRWTMPEALSAQSCVERAAGVPAGTGKTVHGR